ncbi:unnamed protein product [Dicrocoelium dendriticum]|nr:unnamed protein product [Dicrocoelium dendriticum]
MEAITKISNLFALLLGVLSNTAVSERYSGPYTSFRYDSTFTSTIDGGSLDVAILHGSAASTFRPSLSSEDKSVVPPPSFSSHFRSRCTIVDSAASLCSQPNGHPTRCSPITLRGIYSTNEATDTVRRIWFEVTSGPAAEASRLVAHIEALQCLPACPVDRIVNMVDHTGNTALHYAVCHGRWLVVDALIANCPGIDVDTFNRAGYTPSMLAAVVLDQVS